MLISFIFFSGLVFADVEVTTNVVTTGEVNSTHNIDTDGDTFVYINGVDWSGLPDYIGENEEHWGNNGIDAEDLAEILEKLEKYRRGEAVELTKREYNILMSLLSISDMEIIDFYNSQISPILDTHYSQILANLYEIESGYRTFEKLYPVIYCESRQEVMKKYGLKSVVCGLHSKICYNGDLYSHEGGLDYCIYTDDDRSEEGMKIRLKDIEIYDSEEDGLTAFEIDMFNQGEEAFSPVISVDIKKWENILGHFEQELEELGPGSSSKYFVAWDNSMLKTGDYTARAVVYLGKKEIIKEVDFTILPKGTLIKSGEIVSLKLKNQPLTYYDVTIETVIKNHGSIPTAFKVTGDVYRDGEKVDYIESQKILIKSGEIESLQMTYKIPDLGEYEIEVKSNDNMQDMLVFEAVPTTPTGRFMSSPGAAVFGLLLILVIGLYGSRFLYHKIDRKGTIEFVKPYRLKPIKTRTKIKSAGTKRKVTAKKKVIKKKSKKTGKKTTKMRGKK